MKRAMGDILETTTMEMGSQKCTRDQSMWILFQNIQNSVANFVSNSINACTLSFIKVYNPIL
jgi:hypothetical protein